MMNNKVAEDQYSLVEIEEDNINFSMENYKLSERYEDTMTEDIMDAREVEKMLLDNAGASVNRDEIDTAVIQGIKDGTGKIINKPEQSIGWSGQFPELKSEESYEDSDMDGIPDAWEEKVGLNPENGDDGSKETECGYTNLEIYLQSLL